MKPLDDLTFIDDYMFGEVMKNKDICKGVLERLTHLKIRSVQPAVSITQRLKTSKRTRPSAR